MIGRILGACVAFALLALGANVHAKENMRPSYSKSAVAKIQVEKISDNEVLFRYSEQLATMHYAAGVNYQIKEDVMNVVIKRCYINSKCQVMVKAGKPLKGAELNELRLPYHGEKIVVEYTDFKEQVFP